MLNNPKAKIKLPKRTVPVDLRVISRNKITNPFCNIFLYQKRKPENQVSFSIATEEGFEPPLTESESAVLPLHHSAINFQHVLL